MEFKRYKELVEKYYQNDCRELNFQNRVIIPFLEKYSPNFYDVVDSSTLYRNWERYKDDMEMEFVEELLQKNLHQICL